MTDQATTVTEQWAELKTAAVQKSQEIEMDKQLVDKLTESMDMVNNWIEAGADFTAEQAPLVIQEIVTWGIVNGLVWAGGFAFFMLLIQGCAWHLRRNVAKDKLKPEQEQIFKWYHNNWTTCTWIAHYLSFLLMFGVIYNVYHSIYVYCAPRLYVLETLADLLGNAMGRGGP